MRWVPAATITSRSKPSATPAQGGRPAASASRKKWSTSTDGLPVDATTCQVSVEARGLLRRRAEFVEAVGEFERTPERLEARRDVAANLRECGLARRKIVQERQPILRERFGDDGSHRKVEHVVTCGPRAHRIRHRGACVLDRLQDRVDRRAQWIEAETPLEGVAVSDRFARRECPDGFEHVPDQGFDVTHQCVVVEAVSVPLEHRELGVVPPAAFTGAEHLADLVDVGRARAEQPLHRVLGRGLQVAHRRAVE